MAIAIVVIRLTYRPFVVFSFSSEYNHTITTAPPARLDKDTYNSSPCFWKWDTERLTDSKRETVFSEDNQSEPVSDLESTIVDWFWDYKASLQLLLVNYRGEIAAAGLFQQSWMIYWLENSGEEWFLSILYEKQMVNASQSFIYFDGYSVDLLLCISVGGHPTGLSSRKEFPFGRVLMSQRRGMCSVGRVFLLLRPSIGWENENSLNKYTRSYSAKRASAGLVG